MEWSEEERRERLVDALIGNAWNFDEYERWSKYGTYLEPDYEALFAADGRTLKADGIDPATFGCTGGHVVVRVAKGGAKYWVLVLDDSNQDYKITRKYGPYNCL